MSLTSKYSLLSEDTKTVLRAVILLQPWVKTLKSENSMDDDEVVEAVIELVDYGYVEIVCHKSDDGNDRYQVRLKDGISL